jgi:hypothetical protein
MKNLKYILLIMALLSATACFAADEIHIDYESGATVYAARFDSAGDVGITDGNSFETWSTAGDYDVTMTENGTGGHFVGDFDAYANIGDGTYKVTAYEQIGGSPADADRAIYVGTIKWKDGAEDRDAAASDSAVTDALITSSHSTTDGKIDTTDALITSSHSTTDSKIDTTDALITSSHSTTDALVTTVDGVVDSILVLATWQQDFMEADTWTNTATTPWREEIRTKGTENALAEKELYQVDGEDVGAVYQRIGQKTEVTP